MRCCPFYPQGRLSLAGVGPTVYLEVDYSESTRKEHLAQTYSGRAEVIQSPDNLRRRNPTVREDMVLGTAVDWLPAPACSAGLCTVVEAGAVRSFQVQFNCHMPLTPEPLMCTECTSCKTNQRNIFQINQRLSILPLVRMV